MDKQTVVFHKVELYSELRIYTTWMNLKIILLSERSQTKIKSTYKGLHLYKIVENTNLSVMIESRSIILNKILIRQPVFNKLMCLAKGVGNNQHGSFFLNGQFHPFPVLLQVSLWRIFGVRLGVCIVTIPWVILLNSSG